jgi:hypothetical protein
VTNVRSAGTCFGFRVHSDLQFHYLRGGPGDTLYVLAPSEPPVIAGREPLLEWTPTPAVPWDARLFVDGSRFDLWIARSGWFIIDTEAPSIAVPDEGNVIRREERLWGVPAMLCFIARGDLPLHAAAVEVDGQAILLGAPGTFGKTTLAAAFLSAGYRLLSEDVSCVRVSGRPLVIPGPAMLRLRPDVADRVDIGNAHMIGERDGRVHLAVDAPARGDCRPLPISAIVLLRPGEGEFVLERVAPSDAIRDLWPLSFKLPIERDLARCFAGIVELAQAAPIWNLHRPLRIADLPATVTHLVETLA